MKKFFCLLLSCFFVTGLVACKAEDPPFTPLTNPVRSVASPEDYSHLVDMRAPEGAEDCSYSIISDQIAQIRFTHGGVEYTMRGSYSHYIGDEDVSGVHGPFDDAKAKTVPFDYYSDHYTVLLQYTTDGGGLATWSFGSFRGSLYAPALPEDLDFESFVLQVLTGFQDNWHKEPTSEGHLEITSGGEVFYPCMQNVYGMSWDGENMIAYDGVVSFTTLQAYGQLPLIPYHDDFTVTITGDGRLNVIILYDENLKRLEGYQEPDVFSQLEPGTYYAEIVITEDGDYIPEADETEYVGLSCVFELTIE